MFTCHSALLERNSILCEGVCFHLAQGSIEPMEDEASCPTEIWGDWYVPVVGGSVAWLDKSPVTTQAPIAVAASSQAQGSLAQGGFVPDTGRKKDGAHAVDEIIQADVDELQEATQCAYVDVRIAQELQEATQCAYVDVWIAQELQEATQCAYVDVRIAQDGSLLTKYSLYCHAKLHVIYNVYGVS
jgi:hypothetical protein